MVDFEFEANSRLATMEARANEKIRVIEGEVGALSEKASSAEDHAFVTASLEMQIGALQAEVKLKQPLLEKLNEMQNELDLTNLCCSRLEGEKLKSVDDLECILQALAQFDSPDEMSQEEHEPIPPIPKDLNAKLLWGLHRLESGGRLMHSVMVQSKKQAAALASQHKVLRNLGKAQKQVEQEVSTKNDTLNGLIAVMEGTSEQAVEGDKCLLALLGEADSIRSFFPVKNLIESASNQEKKPPKLPPLRQSSLEKPIRSRGVEDHVEVRQGEAQHRLSQVLAAVSSLDINGIDIDPQSSSCAEEAVKLLNYFATRESEGREARVFAESAMKGFQQDMHRGERSTMAASSQLERCQTELVSCQSQLESYKVTMACLQVKNDAASAAQRHAESSLKQADQQHAGYDQDVLWLEEQIDQKEAALQQQREESEAQNNELLEIKNHVVLLKAEAASLTAQLQCLQSQSLMGTGPHLKPQETPMPPIQPMLRASDLHASVNPSSASSEEPQSHPEPPLPVPATSRLLAKGPKVALVAQMRLELECEHQREVATEATEALSHQKEEAKALESQLAARDECIEELLAQYQEERRVRLELEQRITDLNKEMISIQSMQQAPHDELVQAGEEREAKLRADKHKVEAALGECQACLERLLAGSVGSTEEERVRREKAECMLEEERGFFVDTLEKMERELLKMQEEAIRTAHAQQQQPQFLSAVGSCHRSAPQQEAGALHGFSLMGGHRMGGL